ncbi:LysE family translocator [soil metagenome]
MLGVGLDRWLAFTVTEAAVSLTPGPAVALVVGYGLSRGQRAALLAALGILTANLFYFALLAAGLLAVIAGNPVVFAWIKWCGVAWLAWLGIASWLGHATPLRIATRSDGKPLAASLIWSSGLGLQLSNPKVMLSFFAVLPPFVDASAPPGPQMLVFAASSVIPEFLILAGYGWFGARAAPLLERPGYADMTERIAGTLMLLAAIGIAVTT